MLCILFSIIDLKAEYKEIQIPTRLSGDKKYLAADMHFGDTTVAKPVILIQTPYNKSYYRAAFYVDRKFTGLQLPVNLDLYNYVIVDWRGFYGSKDADSALYDRGLDGYDAVEWIAEQPWCNGKVATWGESALGLIQFQTARHQPPHLVCSVPIVKDYLQNYEKYYYGGDLRKMQVESLEKLGFITYNAVINQPTKNGYWKLLENVSDYPRDINIPLLMIEGWFDHYPADVIKVFWELREKSDASVRLKHKLIVGPWLHEGIGVADQGELTYPLAEDVPYEAVTKFFGYYLLGEKINWDGEPVMKYYSIGDDQWNQTDSWETNDSLVLYVHDNGRLSTEPMPETFVYIPPDTILFNPRDPSPSYGGALFNPFDKTLPSGPRDISSKVESRNDILVYSTDELTEDIPVIGRIRVRLYVSSDRTDTDFNARLCDVFPDGRSMIMSQAVLRARFRNSLSNPELMKPDSIYPIDILFDDIAVTFKKGHKFRIDISSSDYPFFDVNPNTGGDLYKASDTLNAVNLVYTSSTEPTQIIIPTSGTVSVNANSDINNLTLFPNPANEFVKIDLENKVFTGSITMYNLQGEQVEVPITANTNSMEISTTEVPSGMYFIRIVDGREVITKSFVVER